MTMPGGLLDTWGATLKTAVSGWTGYTALFSFVLYFIGYLTLRFHLTTLGLGTDLTVLDERYIFTGANFVVYLVSAVPIVILLALLAASVLYVPFRLMPASVRANIALQGLQIWRSPVRLIFAGIIVSVLMIQLVMRQSFLYSNLLLASNIPEEPAWLASLMTSEGMMSLFFSGLIAGTMIPGAILINAFNCPSDGEHFKLLRVLLVFLVAVQVLLLPINYGILVLNKSLPRVNLIGKEPLVEGEQAWLVWEGKDGVTYLKRRVQVNKRSLLTIPKADAIRTEIIGYDRIVPDLVPLKKETSK